MSSPLRYAPLLLATIVAAAAVGAQRLAHRGGEGPATGRAASFGALFFLLALAPSSSVVPLQDPLAEHRVYLASLGFFIALAAAAATAIRRWAPTRAALVGTTVAAAILTSEALATAYRNDVWRTALGFWSDAAEKAPEKVRVQVKLGEAYQEANRPTEALRSFLRARDLPDDHRISYESILGHIVLTLNTLGRRQEAWSELDRALSQMPRSVGLLAIRAQLAYHAGRDAECEDSALSALAVDGHDARALKYLGLVRLDRGDLAGARAALRGASSAKVDPLVNFALGSTEERLGDARAACSAYEVAAGQPGNAWASKRARDARAALHCP